MAATLSRHRLFVYGTLQCPQRLHDLIGRSLPGMPAQLRGYRCGRVARADFPGIVPDPAASTQGQVLCGLTAAELACLDQYEGELYRRVRITTTLANGSSLGAWVYVIAPWAQDRVTAEPWALDTWRRQPQRLTYCD